MIAIADAYNNPSVEYELSRYRSYYKLPPCTTKNGCFRKLNQLGQQGNYPANDEGWAIEESLDVEMASAICPKCHITLVEANTASGQDSDVAENTAAASGANIISNSWTCDPNDSCLLDAKAFNHPGVLIAAAAGDRGYGRIQAYPALYPTVVAVGGTTLQRATGKRGWSESVWSNTGGGWCSQIPKPSWQHDVGCGFRIINDVSAVGDPATGVAVFNMYFPGGWVVIGGTSASTPIIAATYGLAGNASSLNAAQSLYADPKNQLYDVTTGSNGMCSPFPKYFCNGTKGYDAPSGNGTPHGVTAF